MQHQPFTTIDGIGAQALPVSLQNMYLSPTSNCVPQRNMQSSREILLPKVPQPNNDKNFTKTSPFMSNVQQTPKNTFDNLESVSLDMQNENNQGYKIDVNLINKGEVVNRTTLYLKILTPHTSPSGSRERLQVILTGQHRGKTDYKHLV